MPVTTATDYSGNGNDGTLVNGPKWVTADVSPEIQSALSFDGVDDYVEIPDNGDTTLDGDFTIVTWVYPIALTTMEIISKRNSYNNNNTLSWRLVKNGQSFELFLTEGDDRDFSPVNVPNLTVQTDEWTYIALVKDGKHLTVYVNQNSESVTGSYETFYNSTAPIRIGAVNSSIAAPFNGFITGVRIWNTARTQQQIQDNMYTRLNGDESGLVGYWKLDDGVVIDSASLTSTKISVLTSDDTAIAVDTASITKSAVSVLAAEEKATAFDNAILLDVKGNPLAATDVARSSVDGSLASITITSLTGQLDPADIALQIFGDVSIEPVLSDIGSADIQAALSGRHTIQTALNGTVTLK